MDRQLAGVVVLAIVVAVIIVLCATYAFATLEFERSVSQWHRDETYRDTGRDYTPWPAVSYRTWYPYSWLSLLVAVAWGAWILRKATCNACVVALYVGTFANMALFWLLFTLMVLYLMNQSFHA